MRVRPPPAAHKTLGPGARALGSSCFTVGDGVERRRRYTRRAKRGLVAESWLRTLSILRMFGAKYLVICDQLPPRKQK